MDATRCLRALIVCLFLGVLSFSSAIPTVAAAGSEPSLIAFRDLLNGIFTVVPESPPSVKLLYPSSHAGHVSWNPDGTVLAIGVGDPPSFSTSSIILVNRSGQELKTVISGRLWTLDWSPDGKKIAYACQDVVPHDPEVCVVDVETGEWEVITDPADGFSAYSHFGARLSWSPTGDLIAYTATHVIDCTTPLPGIVCRQDDIGVVPASGGATTLLTDHRATGPDWSPDGKQIVFHDPVSKAGELTGVMVMDFETGGTRQVVPLEHARAGSGPVEAVWSPDGKKIAFTSDTDGAESGNPDIFIVDADGGALVNSTKTKNIDYFPSWAPSISGCTIDGSPGEGGARAAEVDCRFRIDWTMPKRFPPADDEIDPADGLPLRKFVLPKEWKLGLFVPDDLGAPQVVCPGRRYRWHIRQLPSGKTRTVMGPEDECTLSTTVPKEGAYLVTATELEHLEDGTWAPTGRRGRQRVVVQDWLIIGLGDSLASGEGNPDQPGPFFGAGWQLAQCHRGLNSYQARVAKRIEDASDRTSVTFLHAACSGADIDNVYRTSYVGVEHGTPLPPQLDQVRKRFGARDREVDAVLLSAGINDLRFGSVMKICAGSAGDAPCMKKRVGEVLRTTGIWELDVQPGSATTLAEFIRHRLYDPFDGLGFSFTLLDGKLGGVERKRVYSPAYPDPSTDEQGATCKPDHPGNPELWRRISEREAGWLRATGGKLNGRIASAAQAHGWTYVPEAEGIFIGHGWCSSQSWMMNVTQSLLNELHVAGAMHPIRGGPPGIARQVAARVCSDFYPGSLSGCGYNPFLSPDGIREPGSGSRLGEGS